MKKFLVIFWYSSMDSRCMRHERFVTFRTTDPTLSLSPLETLCRCIVDHHTLPVVRSLCLSGHFPSQPESSGTLLYVNTLTLSSALHLSTDSVQHMYTYSASRIMVTHGADTICSVFLVTRLSYYSTCYFLLFHMLFLNLPHACCPSLPIMFHPFSI